MPKKDGKKPRGGRRFRIHLLASASSKHSIHGRAVQRLAQETNLLSTRARGVRVHLCRGAVGGSGHGRAEIEGVDGVHDASLLHRLLSCGFVPPKWSDCAIRLGGRLRGACVNFARARCCDVNGR